jgi:hypothetical protein
LPQPASNNNVKQRTRIAVLLDIRSENMRLIPPANRPP